MRPIGSFAELERRRKLAIERILNGYRPSEVARFLGVNDSSIRRWMQTFRAEGKRGLRLRLPPGRPPKLNRAQEKIVLRWLSDDPVEHGFPTSLWTSIRLAQLIKGEFGVQFNPDYLTTWLRSRGCTPQKPKRTPWQRDEKAISEWVIKDWPRIKKSNETGGSHSFPRRKRPNDGSSP